MLSRRDLLASGAVLTQLRPDGAEAAQRAPSDVDSRTLTEIRDALVALRHPATSVAVGEVRRRQNAHLKQNQRYPDFINIGITVWDQLCDWHVENHQELKITRAVDGRYQMEFMTTQLMLHPEISDVEVGLAYDR